MVPFRRWSAPAVRARQGCVTPSFSKPMRTEPFDVLLADPLPPPVEARLEELFPLHRLPQGRERNTYLAEVGGRIRAVATFTSPVTGGLMGELPRLEIVTKLGVGYDSVDVAWALENGIMVTNTPHVLTEEVADTTIGLLIATVRELPRAERYLRAGKWLEGPFPDTRATLRDRIIGIVGMGRIGQAIARRLEGFDLTIVYHSRRPAPSVPYRHFPDLLDMARAVDTLIVIVPGGPATRNLIHREVLEALGPSGILINMARGFCVDEAALIDALRRGTILSAGLDVFVDEPRVPRELLEMDHVVLLPHVGSASLSTRNAMGQLMIDNLRSWAESRQPLTAVPEMLVDR
jgi:lactate dehydrogenase-like 2-hydroxyacid dehydrogenase